MSSSPQYRFFLDETKQIAEPIGWDEIKLELNRDRVYWSLVESVELPFEFYGHSEDGDGGYDYLRQVKDSGVDTQVEFRSEISWDYGDTWEIFFVGLLDLTTLVEIRNKRRFQCGIVRENNWTRFYNLRDNPVQIKDTDNIDHDLILPSQKIRQIYQGSHGDDVSYVIGSLEYGIIDWRDTIRNEVKESYNLPREDSADLPAWKFELEFDGDYTFLGDIYITSTAIYPAGAPAQIPNIEVYVQVNNTQYIWTKTNLGTNGVDGRTHFTISMTLSNLNKGDRIRVYFYNTNGAGSQSFFWTDFFEQLFTLTADTVFKQSSTPAFLIHDVADKIITNLVGEHYFYSEYFGSNDTKYIDYSSDGCGSAVEIMKGIHIRGTSLADKPLALSWNQLWSGIDPIFCLGAGYEYIRANLIGGGVSEKEMLVVMPREYFFDSTVQSVTFDQYDEDDRLEIDYDPQFLITSIKHGYQKWQAQNISGIDDPQTVHTRTTRLKTAGEADQKNAEELSSFVAASLAIEQGRRLSLFQSQDWPLDEDIFIIQVDDPEDVKLYSSSLISGLINSNTRYNVRLTPGSNFNRWAAWFSIAFQPYIGDSFKFSNGEGNTGMSFSDPSATGCDAEPGRSSDEDADILIVTSPLQPDVYKFTVGMTWQQYKAIRDNRKLSIGLNYLDNGETTSAILFIDSLTYYPNKSKAEFKCWLNTEVSGDQRLNLTLSSKFFLSEGVPDPPTWRVEFDTTDLLNNYPIYQVFFPASEAVLTPFNFLVVHVSKLSNGGIAERNGSVLFKLNASTIHTVNFLAGDDVSDIPYTFTGLQDNDLIDVEITE